MALTSHERKELKRKASEDLKAAAHKKAHDAKQRKMLLAIAAASLAVLIVSYFLIARSA